MRTKAWLLGLLLLLPALVACGASAAPSAATPSGALPATATSAPTALASQAPTQAPTEPPMQTPTAQPAEGGATVDVSMKNIRFSPPQITVKAGTTVIWTNDDTVGHTVTSGTRGNPSGLFDSGDVPAGGTFSFTFTEPGTYNYYCKIHPGMDGVVIVEK
jgi:plastocyanin